jgi:hypothetical protein
MRAAAFFLVLCVVNAQQGTIVLVSKFQANVNAYSQLLAALTTERATLTAPVSVVSHGQNIGSVGPISKVRRSVVEGEYSLQCVIVPRFSCFLSFSSLFLHSTPTSQPGVP